MKYQGRHLPLEIDRNIDAVCDEFEAQWASGKTPSIEELLADRTGPERSALLGELLRIELSYRIERGHMPGEDEYGARFPEDAELVRRVLGPEVPITRGPEFTSDRPASERSVGLDDSSDSSAPTRFGRYEVVTVLGKGAIGSIKSSWF